MKVGLVTNSLTAGFYAIMVLALGKRILVKSLIPHALTRLLPATRAEWLENLAAAVRRWSIW
jgi:hypothetical protein